MGWRFEGESYSAALEFESRQQRRDAPLNAPTRHVGTPLLSDPGARATAEELAAVVRDIDRSRSFAAGGAGVDAPNELRSAFRLWPISFGNG